MAGPNASLTHCLALAQQAMEQDGDALSRTLTELQCALLALDGERDARGNAAHNPHPLSQASATEPVITMDLTGYVTGWNHSAEQLFGYTQVEALGRHILFLQAEDDTTTVLPQLSPGQGPTYMKVRRRRKNGEVFWTGISLSLICDDQGHPVAIAGHLSEIPEGLSSHDKMRLHARIIEETDQCIMITDAEDIIVSVNAAFTRVTGYSAAEAIGRTPDLLRSGAHDESFRRLVRAAMHGAGPWHGEIIGQRKDGTLFPQSVTIDAVRDDAGNVTHAFSMFTDISGDKQAAEQIERLVNYDNLTGLPNGRLLNQLVGQAIATSARHQGYGGLIVVDLNRFTAINEGLGHGVGDAVLCEVAKRFRSVLRDADVLSRTGSDEFVVALFDIQKREHCGTVAEKLLATLRLPFEVDANDIYVSACAGIAVYPEDALNAPTLLRLADVTMKRCRQQGECNYLFYSPEMNERAKEHIKLESDLRRALNANGADLPQLALHYQPKVSLRNGRIVGAEALLRWAHPEHGPISPVRFIPLAEETGLILELGAWVLEEACRQISHWKTAGLTPPPIAVNLSARQFDRDLPLRMQQVLEHHGVGADELKLEITESLLMGGTDVMLVMNELVAMGFALALDDFGTGFSSLSYLRRYPISTLKIDRSFVVGVPHEENDCAIARAIVTMGQQLHQEIVAEGVETPEQMHFLRELGCDQLQGYLFSAPLGPPWSWRQPRRCGLAWRNLSARPGLEVPETWAVRRPAGS
ncbi:MAG: EAL domain-containing protein [Rhodocyclales bacterium]|nr:EAL domain-containing protein [Rhodocyclales bacterium]